MHTDQTHRSTLPQPLLRLKDIVRPDGILPLARSTWLAGVKTGRYPKPIMLGPRLPAWRMADIDSLLEGGAVNDG